MADPSWPTNHTFNPLDQNITVTVPDGSMAYSIPLAFTRELQSTAIVGGICAGTQIGAALILLLCLFAMTKTDKRRSLIFVLNAVALLLVVIHSTLLACMFNGPFYNWYRLDLWYFSDTGSAKAVSIAAEVIEFFLIVIIECSLVIQVHVVCCTLQPFRRHAVNTFNGSVALLSVATHFALTVLDIKWNILDLGGHFNTLNKLGKAANILLVFSIGTSTIIFCVKLADAILNRRSLGMTQFGPMQIIFIMGCQTMCTPLIFVILADFGFNNAAAQGFAPTVVALSLPLSAMWATANANNAHAAADRHNPNRFAAVAPPDFGQGKRFGETITTATTMSDTLIDTDSNSPLTWKREARNSDAKNDVEMQRPGGGGVHVNRTYSVRSD